MSLAIDIADAVVSSLNATFAAQFTAVRRFREVYELPDTDDLRVSVVPLARVVIPGPRAGPLKRAVVLIVLNQHLPPEDPDTRIEELATLADLIGDHVVHHRLDAKPAAICAAVTNDPAFDADSLDQTQQFVSIIKAQYEMTEMT